MGNKKFIGVDVLGALTIPPPIILPPPEPPPPELLIQWVHLEPETSPAMSFYFAGLNYMPILSAPVLVDPAEQKYWVWDGTDWQEEVPDDFPDLGGHSLFLNGQVGRHDADDTLVFLGFRANESFTIITRETWIFDGTNWSQVSPSTMPPNNRYHTTMAQFGPSGSGDLILQGGYTFDTPARLIRDTWSWNSSDWSDLSPATTPEDESGSNASKFLAYDPIREELVYMFNQGTDPVRIFTYEGTDWTEKFSETPSSATEIRSLCFDPRLEGVVAVFGNPSHTSFQTWLWDGINLTDLSISTPHANTFNPAMAYDENNDYLIGLFGSSPYETWRLDITEI